MTRASATSLVPLGEVLVLDRDEVQIEPDQSYCTAGIYSFGRGLFQRGHILGAETSYKLLFRLHRDQFVVSRLNGWEGAVDVVPEALEGCLVSNEYPTFSIRSDRAHPAYLRWVARWPAFWERLIPRGSMVRRKRVHPSQLLEVEVPLPLIRDQMRIVERLDSVSGELTRITGAQHEAADFGEATVEAAVWEVFRQGLAAGWPTASLSTVAEVSPPRDRVPPGERVSWVPMAALDNKSGTISPGEREAGEARGGYKQFRKGDVLFARITPSMQNGKCAIFTGPHGHGYGSTEFHVIRPQNGTQARWIHRFLRTKEIRMQAAKHFTGTAGQQRVPADFLRRLEIPVPPKAAQTAALRRVDRIVETGAILRDRQSKSRKLSAAIEPAVLNQVFSSVD